MKWTIDTDEIVSTLTPEQPVSLGSIEDTDTGNKKLVIMWLLPDQLEAAKAFANSLLNQ